MRSLSAVPRGSALALVLFTLSACGDDAPGPDPSASVHVSALATEATTLEGPGGTSLMIPAGATDEDVTITLTTPRSRRTAPAGTTTVSGQITLTPEGKEFREPLELTIPISPSAIPAGKTLDDVVVVRAPQGTGSDAFVPLPTRRAGDAVVASTEHFSDFLAIVVDDGSTPFGACGDETCAAAESCDACPHDCGLCLATSDVTPPVVLALESPATASAVRGDAVVTVRFDEPLMPASVSTTSFALTTSGGDVVDGTFTLDGTAVTFRPAAPLAGTTVHTLTIVGVRDVAGNATTTPYTTTFSTDEATSIEQAIPSNGATGIARDADVTVTMKLPLDPATLSVQSSDGPCSGGLRLSADGFTTCLGATLTLGNGDDDVTLVPTLPLPSGATVALRFHATARDARGFSLGSLPSVAFTVEQDLSAPQVTGSAPITNATDVALDVVIVVTFDELLDPASVTTSTISLWSDGTPVPSTVMLTGSVVTLTPTALLTPDTAYSVAIAGIGDLAGNVAGDLPTVWFRTIARPSVVASRFPNGAVGVHPRADLDLSFDRPVATNTLTMQTSDGPVGNCTGSVIVRDSETCYGGTLAVLSTTDIVIRANTLTLGAAIEVLITPSATDANGIAFAGDVERTFRVSPVNGFAYAITASTPVDGAISSGIGATGVARADRVCDPSGAGAAKALLITADRHVCATENCGLASTLSLDVSDWVLSVGTTYVNANGDAMFTTSPLAPINPPPGDLAASLVGANGNFWWGGTSDWLAGSSNCMDFSVATSTPSAAVGWDGVLTSSWLAGGEYPCDYTAPVLCVAQPPAAPHPIH